MFCDDKTLALLQNTAVKAAGNEIFTTPLEPTAYFTREDDGTLRMSEKTLRIESFAGDVPTVIRFAKTVGDNPSIWYDRDGAEAVVSDTKIFDRKHVIRFPLEPSKPFATLISWNPNGVKLTHKELFRLLRTTFYDCLAEIPDLIARVGKINVEAAAQSQSEISRTKTSIGKSAMAAAGGLESVPDVIRFTVPIFETPYVRVNKIVRVSFDFDPSDDKTPFVLTPLPGEIEIAWSEGEAKLYRQIESGIVEEGGFACPVYFGDFQTK